MGAIFKRELQGYFYTPTGYVFMGVFLALSGVCFGVGNLATRSGDLLTTLQFMSYLWMLLSPVLVMRLMAGERKQHTDQLLFSCPCPLFHIVAGKFLAACTVMLASVALTGVYPLLVAVYGTLYLGETLVGYLGFILQGCCFIALDLMISCIARTQMTATIACFGVNLFLWLADIVSQAMTDNLVGSFLNFASLYQRFRPFANGQLSFASLLFNVIFVFTMLFLCARILDARRWSEA